MADLETIITTSPPLPSESENSSSTIPKMEDTEAEIMDIAMLLRIWSPAQTTRDTVVISLIETLSKKSMISERYEALRHNEALPVATSIEEQAYVVASAVVLGDDDGDFEILAAYFKEISKNFFESVKSRPVDSVKLET